MIDKILFKPSDVDLSKSPLRDSIVEETFVLGAFNPALERLPNGNLILMVRIAEALKNPIKDNFIRCIRWDLKTGFAIEKYNKENANCNDPRQFQLKEYTNVQVLGLTSISWLLPVELNSEGTEIINIHYEKAIIPEQTYQEYGIEDPRITIIDSVYYMTAVCVSSERLGTLLYKSTNGIDFQLEGLIFDHLNKDVVLFPEKINNKYYALTRPLGVVYFCKENKSKYNAGPTINMAQSPDLIHWKPTEKFVLKSKKASKLSFKIGGGAPPILTSKGWLVLFHGVEQNKEVGNYRTFWCLLDKNNPESIKYMSDTIPLLEANKELEAMLKKDMYLSQVVFTTGIVENKDYFIVASGENDLACRITHIHKSKFETI